MKKQLLPLAAVLLLVLTACGSQTVHAPSGIAGAYQNTRWILEGPDGRCERTVLILEEGGHFILRTCIFQPQPEEPRRTACCEGRFDLKGSVLTLHCGRRDYELLYLDGKIYFDTLEKRS